MNQEKIKKDNSDRLFVGIDLGTSWTAVMSSRGAKIRFRSVVGYPKDIIAQKVLGKNCVIGEEALDNRGGLSLHFPVQEGVINYKEDKDVVAASELLTHALSLAKPRATDRICGIIGVPAQVEPEAQKVLLAAAKELMHEAVIVSEPFLVAFGQNQLTDAVVVDIGGGTTDICGLKGSVPGPEDQRAILKAGNHVDEVLFEALKHSYPGLQITRQMARTLKEQYSFVGDNANKIQVPLRKKGIAAQYDITSEVRYACESIVPDIVDEIELVLKGFDLEKLDRVLQNILLSGGGAMITGMEDYLAEQLSEHGDIVVKKVADPFFAGCQGALKVAEFVEPDLWHRVGIVA